MGTQPADTWRSPKGLLALISLLLCGLLWLNGLAGSLARPSVGDALELRQLELAALAEPALPEPWRAPLLGSDPLGQLRQQLAAAGAAAETPLPDSQLTTWGLLEQLLGRPQQARQILAGLPNGVLPPGQQLSPLQQRLQCELTGRSRSQCSQPVVAGAALRRLLLVTLAPAVLMLLGVLLLLRQLWLWRQGRLVPVAPLQGPQLSLIEVALVVAGGFVVLGELVAPLLLGPLLSRALAPLAADPPLQQALSVLLLYATLMLGPLLILIAFLRQRGRPPRWLAAMELAAPASHHSLGCGPVVDGAAVGGAHRLGAPAPVAQSVWEQSSAGHGAHQRQSTGSGAAGLHRAGSGALV